MELKPKIRIRRKQVNKGKNDNYFCKFFLIILF